jgi:hypothetical protein
MLMRDRRVVAAFSSILAAGCGGTGTGRTGVADRVGDAQTNDGAGGRLGPGDAGAISSRADATTIVDAAKGRDTGTSADGSPDLCAPGASVGSPVDAGKCLGIFYATVARLVLWVDDGSAPGQGSRVTLAQGETKTSFGHTYRYSGNSLITSGSKVEIYLDVDGHGDALRLDLTGCAAQTGPRSWDYPATLGRALCAGCNPTSIPRHYAVLQAPVDGGMQYTFTADEPPRTCGAGVDLLSFVTFPD